VFSGQKIKLEDFEAPAMPHFDDLYRTAVRVIGNRTEAEDLVQEAYLQGLNTFPCSKQLTAQDVDSNNLLSLISHSMQPPNSELLLTLGH
jgi:hypothetical protein